MTLDIPKFIENSVRTQSKIHHLDINVKAVKKDDVPESVASLVYKDYGDKYLDDADYVAFFWGGINKDNIDKLFNVVDKALGKSANKLTDKDFKKLHMDDLSDVEDTEEDVEIEIDKETSEKPDEQDDEEEEIEVKDKASSSDDEDDDKEKLDEDDENLEAVIEEKPKAPTSYFFLKITSK